MTDVTQILLDIESGDPTAAARLLPLVYEELRKLATYRMAQEKPGNTLDATSLVHEAYLRMVNTPEEPKWNSRGHFFAAAAEAMRRILIEHARRKSSVKRGGKHRRIDLDAVDISMVAVPDDLLDIDAALTQLAAEDPQTAQLIQLRYFAGLSMQDAAEIVGISRASAYENWAYARVRLKSLMDGE